MCVRLYVRSGIKVTSWDGVTLLALDLLLTLGETRDGNDGESVLTSMARDELSPLKGLNTNPSLTGARSARLSILP
jgi:hypothetical protein